MKIKLTKEESDRLFAVGFDKKYAYAEQVWDAPRGDEWGADPIITLTGLMEILPAVLQVNEDKWPLTIKHHEDGRWSASYGSHIMVIDNEPIDVFAGLYLFLNTSYE